MTFPVLYTLTFQLSLFCPLVLSLHFTLLFDSGEVKREDDVDDVDLDILFFFDIKDLVS